MRAITKLLAVLLALCWNNAAFGSHGSKSFGILIFASCGFISKEYERKVVSLIERMRAADPELSEALGPSPISTMFTPERREQQRNLTGEQLTKAKKDCDEAIASFERDLLPGDERFSTPEKTWRLFLASLKSGDKETLGRCLEASAREKFLGFFVGLDQRKLAEIADSFTGFQVTGDMGDLQDAMVTRSNGVAGMVTFSRRGQNWKIVDM